MKKITSFIMAIIIVILMFALVACNDKEKDATQGTAELVETVAEKTPLEAYKLAYDKINLMTEYELEIETKYVLNYSGQTQTSVMNQVYRTDGNTAYCNTAYNGQTDNEYWYTGEILYTNSQTAKQKNEITKDEYSLNYAVKGSDVIFAINDSAFSGKKFEKKDGAYYVSVEITPQEYYTFSGLTIDKNAICKIGFDDKCEIVSFAVEAAYTEQGMIVNVTRTINFKKFSDIAAVSSPSDADSYKTAVTEESLDKSVIESADKVTVTDEKTNLVMIDVADYGKIIVRLYPEVAPKTVENFKNLVAQKYYDGVIFHRVIEGFMIQGGDGENGDGTGGSDTTIKGEFNSNGFTNNLTHKRGVISMARTNDPDSASSQFFIVHKDSAHLDGQYASFGYVVCGMDVVDEIAEVRTDSNDKPTTEVKMNSIRFVKVN